MNCAEAKRILAFTREGELVPGEERALEAHLRTCPVCMAERASFLEQNRNMEKLRSIIPVLRDPEENAQAILDRVRVDMLPRPQGLVGTIVDQMIRALEFPGLRYALAVFVTVIVTGFVVQQVAILGSVSALEARLSQSDPPRLRMAYSIPRAEVDRLARSGELRAIFQILEAPGGAGPVRFDASRAGAFWEVLHSPGSRWMLRTLLPGVREGDIDTLVAKLARNVRMIMTYSKGEDGK